MKFKLSEHPSIFMFLISLVILGTTIFLNVMYKWKIYSIVGLVLSGIASLVLLFSVCLDIYHYLKKKPEQPTYQAKEDESERD